MTFHILTNDINSKLIAITQKDIDLVSNDHATSIVLMEANPFDTIKKLSQIEYAPGDVICLAGLCPRQTIYDIIEIAKQHKENFMPGEGTDHRGVPIPEGKIKSRLAIEKNFQTAWPYLAVIGDPESAKLSFELLEHLSPDDYWHEYTPEDIDVTHLFSVLTITGLWSAPAWFKITDLSVRDLELAPVMYASHMWHDWIAFYPSDKHFKLENHTQLNPVWLARSEKPMEYWQHE